MVNPVNALARSLASLRVALARAIRTAPRGRAAASTAGAGQPEPTPGEAAASELALLPQRLVALTGDGAVRERQALRLFIRAVLLDEFRGAMEPTPDFDELVERAAGQLEGSEEFAALMREAMGELLAGEAGGERKRARPLRGRATS